jgi:hypothetical protein
VIILVKGISKQVIVVNSPDKDLFDQAIFILRDEAVAQGKQQVVVSGNIEIEETVLLPSDFTLVLDDCHLVMADNTFCNMFTNVSCRKESARKADGADRNIKIEGRGRAILDGGNYNGLSERNSGKDGLPHISVNNLVLFANVDGFRISGLHMRNQRWWAMNFMFCRNGYISNIDFLSDYTRVDENGNRVEGLIRDDHDHEDVYIKNSDGVDIRCGCHDIMIENITGFTEDDTVALTGLKGKMEAMFGVEELCPDIYNIIVRNINSAAFCSNVRLLNQGGIKLYNILVDGVYDASANCKYLDRGGNGVRVGDIHMYGSRHSTADETYNITIRNVVSRAKTAAVNLAGVITNLTLDNISTFDGCGAKIINNAQF